MLNTRLIVSPLLLLGATTMACRSAVDAEIPPGAVALDMRPLPAPVAQYFYSGLRDRARLAIRDADAWTQFWNTLTSRYSPQPPVPELDFAAELVLVAAMGGRPTGGYSIHIDDVYEVDGRLYVVVREVSPGSDCYVTQAGTSPIVAVRIPRREGHVTFVERTETLRCD